MTSLRLMRIGMAVFAHWAGMACWACAAEPLGTIFQNLPTATTKQHIWDQAAQAQSTAGPKFRSTAEETKVFEGFFVPGSADVELWAFSDDGVNVQVKQGAIPGSGDPVQLANQGNPQHLPSWDTGTETQPVSLHKVPVTLQANQCYGVRLEYQNLAYNGAGDIDGCTLFAIKESAAVVKVEMTAHRPTTEGPAYGNPFDKTAVPNDEEETPGAGIRINGDDDNNNENDLIEVILSAPVAVCSGFSYLLKRSNGNIKVWTSQSKETAVLDTDNETTLTFSSATMTVWVENPSGGSTHDLAERLDDNRGAIGTFTIEFTAYIDAVENDSDSDFDIDQEHKRPPGSDYHMSYYRQGTVEDGFLDGGPIDDPPGADFQDDVDDPNVTETHFTIDDEATVLDGIESRLTPRVNK